MKAVRVDESRRLGVESKELKNLATEDGLLADVRECSILGFGGPSMNNALLVLTKLHRNSRLHMKCCEAPVLMYQVSMGNGGVYRRKYRGALCEPNLSVLVRRPLSPLKHALSSCSRRAHQLAQPALRPPHHMWMGMGSARPRPSEWCVPEPPPPRQNTHG